MRILASLLLLTLCGTLVAIPILTESIVHDLYHGEISGTRCVTGFYDRLALYHTITHLTIWDIETPGAPKKGNTLFEEVWSGLYTFSKFKLWQNYLIYTNSRRLAIVDINNIHAPTQVFSLPISGIYSFEIMDHYLIIGWQDGNLEVYDISNPANPLLVDTFYAEVSVWNMWSMDDKLLVSCGNYSYNTLKAYCFTDGVLTELCTLETGEKVEFAAISCGKLMYQNPEGELKIYRYQNHPQPQFIQSYPATDAMPSIICGTNHLASIDASSCIRIWHYNEAQGLTEIDYYDLSQTQAASNTLFCIKNGCLYFELDKVLMLTLDLRDVNEEPTFIANYCDGTVFNTVKVSRTANRVYTQNNTQMRCYDINTDHGFSEAEFFSPYDAVYGVEMKGDNLYYQCFYQSPGYHLKCVDVTNPVEPSILANIPIDEAAFFGQKGEHLYSGTLTHIDKYILGDDGVPVWQKRLSHVFQISDYNYSVHFYDIVSTLDADYGVGYFGDWFMGYFPIFVWWRPDGIVGTHLLNRFCRRLELVDDYLYLLTQGIDLYRIDENGRPIFVDDFYSNSIYNQAQYSHLVDNRYLYVSFMLTNSICCFDLENRLNPVLINIVRHNSLSHEFAFYDNIMLSAIGKYGINQHIQPNLTNIQNELTPAVQFLKTYPNPFSDRLYIDFTLDKAANTTIEIYNIKGQKVYSNQLEQIKSGGNSTFWNGSDHKGTPCAPGVYLMRINSGDTVLKGKFTKIK